MGVVVIISIVFAVLFVLRRIIENFIFVKEYNTILVTPDGYFLRLRGRNEQGDGNMQLVGFYSSP